MWKWLIGPLLAGSGWVTGSIYGRDAEQIVHKSPGETHDAMEQTIENVPATGATHFDGGRSIPYEVKLDRGDNRQLTVTVLFDGRQGAEADLNFVRADGGKATLMTAHIHGDHAVLREVLAGTDKAKLGYAPDWMLNLAARPLLARLADQIEKGETGAADFGSDGNREDQLTPDQRNEVQEWRQYDATRPTTDPDASAQQYMNGNGD